MAAPNVDNIYRSPGRLVANPTSLQSAYPHGGTELGIARDMMFRPNIKTRKLIAEEYKAVVEVVVTGVEAVMAGVLRTWDPDLIKTLFLGSQGSVGGIQHNVRTHRAGYALSNKGITLFFSPMAVDLHECILIYNAVPIVDEAFEMRLSLDEELGVPFFFQALPDSQGRDFAIDLRKNLTL